MSAPGLLKEWAATVLREGIGIGAVFQVCVNRGISPQRARDLAEEAVQGALARAVEIADLAGRFEQSFTYFCNWVRRVAINHARSALRQERRQRPWPEGGDVEDTPPDEPPRVSAVRAFLERLTEEERHLLLSRYDEDATLDDLARRYLPPDDRTENARRLVIWRRQRDIMERLWQWLRENSMGPPVA